LIFDEQEKKSYPNIADKYPKPAFCIAVISFFAQTQADMTASIPDKARLSQFLRFGAAHGNAFTPDTPVIHVHFINDDDRGLRIFIQHTGKQLGNAMDKLGFLFGTRSLAAARYLDIDKKRIEFEEEQLRTQAPDFWDDPARAQEQMKKVEVLL